MGKAGPISLKPRVSLILVNYNSGDYLRACLQSLCKDWRDDYELIVLDNASSDSSAEDLAAGVPGMRLLRSATNLGFARGNNLAAAAAQGRYLAFLNPDTLVDPGWLEALVAALEGDPQAGLATAKILLLADRKHINTCGNRIHYTGLTLCRGLGAARSDYALPGEVDAVSGAAFVMRRDLFETLGGFDERFFLYMEDTDLSWRARLAGYRCLYVPSAIVYHDYVLRFGPHKTFYQERNRYYMLLKSLRWRTLLLLLPALLLAELITWGFILLREPGRLGNKLQAYWAIVAGWRSLMRGRRATQQLRRVSDRQLLAMCDHRLAYEQSAAGGLARWAHRLCDPPFYILQQLSLLVIRW